MRIGLVGLGKMGANMAERLLADGHAVVGMDLSAEARARLRGAGGEPAADLGALVAALPAPRAVWLMVPAGVVDATLDALVPLLSPGDVVVDGGNSNHKLTRARGERLAAAGLSLVDAGTSGGIWGKAEGYSLMVGGTPEAVAVLEPALRSLAPTPDTGWGHVGPSGAGHYVKMIHNGIEYGMMQAYAEGFDLLAARDDLDLDLHQVAEIWRHGSVVRSWLLDLTARALDADPALDAVAPYVADSGEGRWTVDAAVELGVPAPVITLALMQRFASQDERQFGNRLLAALRHQFGGHATRAGAGAGGKAATKAGS